MVDTGNYNRTKTMASVDGGGMVVAACTLSRAKSEGDISLPNDPQVNCGTTSAFRFCNTTGCDSNDPRKAKALIDDKDDHSTCILDQEVDGNHFVSISHHCRTYK